MNAPTFVQRNFEAILSVAMAVVFLGTVLALRWIDRRSARRELERRHAIERLNETERKQKRTA